MPGTTTENLVADQNIMEKLTARRARIEELLADDPRLRELVVNNSLATAEVILALQAIYPNFEGEKVAEENDEALQREIEDIILDPNVSEKEKQMLYSSYLHEILANFVSITKVSEFGRDDRMLDAKKEFRGWKELEKYFYKDPYEDEYTDQEVVSILTHLRSIESNYSSGRSIYITGASRMAQVDRKRLSGEELFAYDKVVNLQIWSGFIPDYQE